MTHSKAERANSDFEFTLKVKISPLQRIQSDDISIVIENLFDGVAVELLSADTDDKGNRRPFKWSTSMECKASGFSSESDAHSAGLKFRDAILVASCASKLWIDAGEDIGGKFESQAKGARSRLESYSVGLEVHRGPKEMNAGFGVGGFLVASGDSEQLKENILKALQKKIILTETQQLALSIYGLAHFESTVRAQFVLLTTVIEILSTRENRPPESLKVLENLIAIVNETSIEAGQKSALRDSLSNLKNESISSACRRLMNSYLGEEIATEFTKLYSVRSKLVHEGNPKGGTDFVSEASRLTEITASLVESMFLK